MKKTYFTPELKVVKMPKQVILSGSDSLELGDETAGEDGWEINTND